MRLKLTILLLVLNAALFGLIYYMEKSPSEFARYDALVFQAGVVENAARIEIRSNVLNQAWVMERETDGWSVSEPINWPANPYAATRILNQLQFLEKQARFPESLVEEDAGACTASTPAKVAKLAVHEGQIVRAGTLLVVLEAMKMEQPLSAAIDGVVKTVFVSEGEQVQAGQRLVELEASE